MDDIFDKLDQKRVELIMQLIEEKYFGQIFITDTDEIRVSKAIETTKLSYKIHRLLKIKMKNRCIIIICLQIIYCNNYEIVDIKKIEGAWEIYHIG